jgi:CRISPR-associated protein Cas2
MRVLIAYDIPDDKRRYRIFKLLKGHLWPAQESVFEGELEEDVLADLRFRLSRVYKSEDRLLIAPLCQRCAEKVERYGWTSPDEDDGPYVW